MGLINGQGTTIQFGFDTTWGTGGTPTYNVTHKSESLSYIADKKEEESLVGGRASRGVQTLGSKVEGDISFVTKADEIGAILAWTTGEESATTQIDASTAYKHTFIPMKDPSGSMPKASVQVDRKLGVEEYTSCKVDSLKLSGSAGGFIEGSITLKGYDEKTGSLGSVSKSELKAFKFGAGSITIDGTPFNDIVSSFDIDYGNSLESDQYTMGSNNKMAEIEAGKLSVSSSIEMRYDTASYNLHKDKFKKDESINVEITLTSTEEIEAGYPYSITIKMPVAEITDSKANLSGADRIVHSLTLNALEDNTHDAITFEVVDAKDTAYLA
jgi:hypothetical protein